MGLFNRMGWGALAFVPLMFFGTASAQTTYTATPISAGPITGGVSNVRFEVLPSGGGSARYGNAVVPVSKASLGKMAVGSMARHPAIHLAIMAYVALHEEWEWDAEDHRFRQPEEPVSTETKPTSCQPLGSSGHHIENDTYYEHWFAYNRFANEACGDKVPSGWGVFVSTCPRDPPPGCGTSHYAGYRISVGTAPPTTGGDLVPHEDVGQRLEQAPESITNQITNNVINQNNTTIENEWNELHLTRVNIENDFANETPDGQWTQTPVTGDTHNTFEMDFPVFCEWAGIVCDFINWFQSDTPPPEDPDLPTEETDEPWEEWDSGMPSAGSCPAPHTTEFMDNEISIPFDDFCYGLETYFRPIFIALAMFAAGFILVGARP